MTVHRITIYLFLLSFLTITHQSYSQTLINRQEIDSLIGYRLKDKENLKESVTFVGQIRVYKKILGINIRIKKGEGYQKYIIYDNKLLYHRDVSIFFKHYGNDIKSEEYYYINDKFVKYQMTIAKRDKESNVLSIKDSLIVYMNNENIISSEAKNPITKTTLEYINKQAKADIKLTWDTKPNS
jgi:hypothetical protein